MAKADDASNWGHADRLREEGEGAYASSLGFVPAGLRLAGVGHGVSWHPRHAAADQPHTPPPGLPAHRLGQF